TKSGTGGGTGVDYLRKTLDQEAFRFLIEVRACLDEDVLFGAYSPPSCDGRLRGLYPHTRPSTRCTPCTPHLVPTRATSAALARHPRPLRDLGQRNHVPANPRRYRHSLLSTLDGAIPDASTPRKRRPRGRAPPLARARLLPARAQSAQRRCVRCRTPERTAAHHLESTAGTAWHRALYRWRHRLYCLRRTYPRDRRKPPARPQSTRHRRRGNHTRGNRPTSAHPRPNSARSPRARRHQPRAYGPRRHRLHVSVTCM